MKDSSVVENTFTVVVTLGLDSESSYLVGTNRVKTVSPATSYQTYPNLVKKDLS